MRRFTFSDSLIKVYDKIDEKIIDLKSGVMELCADIQRFFEINLGVQLTENEPIVMNDTFIRYFPNLAKMTPLQLEQLIMMTQRLWLLIKFTIERCQLISTLKLLQLLL